MTTENIKLGEFNLGDSVYYYINHEGIYKSDRHKKRVIGVVVEHPNTQRKRQRIPKGVYVRFGEGANAVYKNILPERLIKLTSELETA